MPRGLVVNLAMRSAPMNNETLATADLVNLGLFDLISSERLDR